MVMVVVVTISLLMITIIAMAHPCPGKSRGGASLHGALWPNAAKPQRGSLPHSTDISIVQLRPGPPAKGV
jgi:hypothetical protein